MTSDAERAREALLKLARSLAPQAARRDQDVVEAERARAKGKLTDKQRALLLAHGVSNKLESVDGDMISADEIADFVGDLRQLRPLLAGSRAPQVTIEALERMLKPRNHKDAALFLARRWAARASADAHRLP
jgi:hypothetical protein